MKKHPDYITPVLIAYLFSVFAFYGIVSLVTFICLKLFELTGTIIPHHPVFILYMWLPATMIYLMYKYFKK